jgi:two-component system response regulator (stage 0 sporulation protein F)
MSWLSYLLRMKTTLLIYDEPDRSDLVNTLCQLGHNVIARHDVLSALSVLRDGGGVDLIIMDCRTNGMDFLELLDSLKKIAPAVPSIMLTENGSIEAYLQACNLGAFEYLNKPVKTEEIVRIVRAALKKTQAFDNQNRAPYQEAG